MIILMQCSVSQMTIALLIIPYELNRLYNHLILAHPNLFQSILKSWIEQNPQTNIYQISCNDHICKYILSKVLQPHQRPQTYTVVAQQTPVNSDLFPELGTIDPKRLNQVILEQGIAENQPLATISSENHAQFISGFFKLGFKYGRDTNISTDEFMKLANGLKVSRNLLNRVGGDYFLASILPFKNGSACFQIDAGKICKKSILTFVLSAINRYPYPMVFDAIHDFDCTVKGYRNATRDMINKAKQNDINIVGLVTDNLPTQVSALSHMSDASIQKVFPDMESIIHLRCCNHLLALAFKDWKKIKDQMTEYEDKLYHIAHVFKRKPFIRFLRHKIPSIGLTRWYSPFNVLEMMLKNRNEFIQLFDKPNRIFWKGLNEIKEDFMYIITIGFTQIYPLLLPFLKLTFHLQSDQISCVHAVYIIQFYIDQMNENIIRYNIPDIGKQLIKKIENRLLLHKNVQIYQLASLLTPDGIVRYRGIVQGEYSIPETGQYWHIKEGFFESELFSAQNTQDILYYQNHELDRFISVVREFSPKRAQKRKESNEKNSSNNKGIIKKKKQILLDGFITKNNTQKKKNENHNNLSNNSNISDISDISDSDEVIYYENRIDLTYENISNDNKARDDYSNKNNSNDNASNDNVSNDNASNDNVSNDNASNDNVSNDNVSNDNASNNDVSNENYSIENVSNDNYLIGSKLDSGSDEYFYEEEEEYYEEDYNEEHNENDQKKQDDYKYFDEKDDTHEQYEDNLQEEDCYKDQKAALKWTNISNLIIQNASFLGLSKDEAINGGIEINKLLLMPFSTLQNFCPGAIGIKSNFMNYWTNLEDFEYNGSTFATAAKIAFRLYPISASEAGTERAFSNFGWKFDDRRNRISHETMTNEIYVQNAHSNKIKKNDDYSKVMWNLPPAKK